MDVSLPLIAVVTSLAAALAGYRAGKSRGHVNHRKELNRVGAVVGIPRHPREDDHQYAERLLQHIQTEHRDG